MVTYDDLPEFGRRCVDAFVAECARIRAIDDPMKRAMEGVSVFGRGWVEVVYADMDVDGGFWS